MVLSTGPNTVTEMTTRLLTLIGVGTAIWWALYFLVRFLPMRPQARNRLLRILAMILIILIAGPEAGLGAEAIATLDALGAELFLTSLIIGLRMLPIWFIFGWLRKLLERADPYFFVPSTQQVRDCPPIVCHALPCFIPICLAAALWGATQVDV